MSLPPYVEFFGSLVDADFELGILQDYILHVDESLREAESNRASRTQTMGNSLIEQAKAEHFSELLTETFPNRLHAGFIISVIIFLECKIANFSKNLQNVDNLGLSLNDLSGSLIDKFRKYCNHIAKIPFLVSNSNWEDLRGAYEIRNCLVHYNGFLKRFKKDNTIRAFIKRHDTPEIEDDMLKVDLRTSLIVLEIVKKFIEAIHEGALEKYPKKEEKI